MFEFRPDRLIVTRNIWRYIKRQEIAKFNIDAIRQVKDSGEEDCVDTWGLVLEAEKKYTILDRQEIEKSEWLGKVIEDWSGKKYISCEDESKKVELV